MSLEPLRQILRRADAPSPALFAAEEVAPGRKARLENYGVRRLLREDAPAEVSLARDAKSGALEKVEFAGEGDDTRAIIVCSRREDMEPIEVPLERLSRWGGSREPSQLPWRHSWANHPKSKRWCGGGCGGWGSSR